MILIVLRSFQCWYSLVEEVGDIINAILMLILLPIGSPISINHIFNWLKLQTFFHALACSFELLKPQRSHLLLFLLGQLPLAKAFPSIFEILLHSYDPGKEDKLWEGSHRLSIVGAGLFDEREYDFCCFWASFDNFDEFL